MLLGSLDYCDCTHRVGTAVGIPQLPSHICSLAQRSKLYFQASKVGPRSKGARHAQLLLGLAAKWTAVLPVLLLYYSGCLQLVLLSCRFLSIVLIGFSLFFFFLLLCYPQSFWNQQYNGKYLNKTYKVFDPVEIFFALTHLGRNFVDCSCSLVLQVLLLPCLRVV